MRQTTWTPDYFIAQLFYFIALVRTALVLFTSLLFVSNRICATEVIFYNNNKNNNNKAICLFESVSAGNKRPGCTIKDGQCVEKLAIANDRRILCRIRRYRRRYRRSRYTLLAPR